MGSKDAPTKAGREAGEAYRREAAKEERKVEAEKGSDLKKGAARVDERSKSSDGKSVGAKQRD